MGLLPIHYAINRCNHWPNFPEVISWLSSKYPASASEALALKGQKHPKLPIQMYMGHCFRDISNYDPKLIWSFMKAHPRSLQDFFWQSDVGWWRQELVFIKNKRHFRDRMCQFQAKIKKIREVSKGLFDGVWMKPEAYLAVASRIDHPAAGVFADWVQAKATNWEQLDAAAIKNLQFKEEGRGFQCSSW